MTTTTDTYIKPVRPKVGDIFEYSKITITKSGKFTTDCLEEPIKNWLKNDNVFYYKGKWHLKNMGTTHFKILVPTGNDTTKIIFTSSVESLLAASEASKKIRSTLLKIYEKDTNSSKTKIHQINSLLKHKQWIVVIYKIGDTICTWLDITDPNFNKEYEEIIKQYFYKL